MSTNNARLIKYMGSASVREISVGETAGGTLPPLPCILRWKQSNDWILDTSNFPEVHPAWWDYLVERDSFSDVTRLDVKPLNRYQSVFLAMKGASAWNSELDQLSSDSVVEEAPSPASNNDLDWFAAKAAEPLPEDSAKAEVSDPSEDKPKKSKGDKQKLL